jgi:septum formation protein
VQRQGHHGLILAADTVSLVGSTILGKPADRDDACRMLSQLSDTEHAVLTGWCLLRTGDGLSSCGIEETSITMRKWTSEELRTYLDSGEWQGKCGAYGLQLPQDPFVVSMRGSAANVIGLPLERLAAVFAEFPTLSGELQK